MASCVECSGKECKPQDGGASICLYQSRLNISGSYDALTFWGLFSETVPHQRGANSWRQQATSCKQAFHMQTNSPEPTATTCLSNSYTSQDPQP